MAVKGAVETVPCNSCGADDYKTFYREGDWTIVKCKQCGHCFTNPRPTPDSLHLYYEEAYFRDERHYNKFYNPDGTPKIEDVSGVYNNRVSDVEHFVSQRGWLLDIGAARGAFIYKLKQRGWNVQGIEISADAVEFGGKAYGVDIHCGTADDFTPTGPFDVITMYQTFEHIPNPNDVLKRCFNWLKPGGILVIEVPNRLGFEMRYSRQRRHLSYDLPRHMNHFSPRVLQLMLERTRFKVLHKDFYYPKFLISLMNRRQTIGRHQTSDNRQQTDASGATKAFDNSESVAAFPPLMRKPSGLNQKLLESFTKVFPGWRMTMIAQKPFQKASGHQP